MAAEECGCAGAQSKRSVDLLGQTLESLAFKSTALSDSAAPLLLRHNPVYRAVVLGVHGIDALRVIDASVAPAVASTNTNSRQS